MSRHHDTIAALATPVGTAALAVIRVSGPDTERLVTALWGGVPPPRELRRGDYRDAAGRLVDDVLYVFFRGPRSYTGEDSLEISCHGNPFIAQRIVEDLFARGARAPEPGEFTLRAFLNGRMDLSQAEAVMDLIQSRGDRAIEVANGQLRGGLSRKMAELTRLLAEIVAEVEAYIDFPEEDLPPEDSERLQAAIERCILETSELKATARYGDLLRSGVRTVIVGAPNVGKSSLLNRLVGHDRALVSPEPGTTRDYIEETVVLGPYCLRLIDTAGLNVAPGEIERLGMARSMERVAEADLILVMSDASQPDAPLPIAFSALPPRAAVIRIVNKIDLLPSPAGVRPTRPDGALAISVRTGEGLEQLRRTIAEMIDAMSNTAVDEGMVAVNARHERALEVALESLEAALIKIQAKSRYDFVASDLRATMDAFASIGGKIDNEQILDVLFQRFCIGK